jgi:hypothetical protein
MPKKKQPVKKKRAAKLKHPTVTRDEFIELARRVDVLTNDWTGQVVALAVKFDQHSLAIQALERRLDRLEARDNVEPASLQERIDDIVTALAALHPVVAELGLRRVEDIRSAVKRHEEQYHLPIDLDEAITPTSAGDVLGAMFPNPGEPDDQH